MTIARSLLASGLLICCGAAVSGRAAGQGGPPQQTFRSGVSLLELSVLDSNGAAVPDLRETDFEVRIGGTERKVVIARFRESSAASPSTAPHRSFGSNATDRTGQVIVLAVDVESLRSGYERLMLNTAAGLLESLSANDAVGLLTIPGKS